MTNYPAWVFGWQVVNGEGFAPSRAKPTKYRRYLASPHWRTFRGIVLVMANSRCYMCGGHANEVHHLSYARLGKERLADVAPVCHTCHYRLSICAKLDRLVARMVAARHEGPTLWV